MVRIWVVAVVTLASGCLGRVKGKTDAEAGGLTDARNEAQVKPDGPGAEKDAPKGDGSLVDHGICSASGVASTCDPLTNTGCSAGDCYITKVGHACVCPVGTATTGQACNTTTDCAPTNVCAGQSPPGICRLICDPKAVAPCSGGELCISIQGQTTVGYCSPRD